MGDPVEQAATLDALSQRLRRPLRRFFEKRLGSQHAEIEDLVQEVFVRLAASREIRPGDRLDGYVFRTAVNLLHDYRRRRIRRDANAHEPFDEALHGGASDGVTPERKVLGAEAIERLVAALYGLPERTRNVWVLYHFEDMRHAEIASRLGMAQSTVEKHMSRANAHLLRRIDQFL
jgi:RNA polymerase sigma factor (sigma-70 family)